MNFIKRLFGFKKTYSSLKNYLTPFVYVALGDSTAEGMGATVRDRSYPNIVFMSLKERYLQTKYFNFARGGATISMLTKHQLPKAIVENPSLITISIGANDIIARTKLEIFEEKLRYLLRELHDKTDAVVLISTVPDLSLTPAIPKLLKTYSKYKAGKLNDVIRQAAAETDTILVDLFEDSRAILEAFPEAVASDGWHPSDFGYALWANSILVTLRNVLAPAPENNDQTPRESAEVPSVQ